MKDLFFHKYATDKDGNALNSVICKTECISRQTMSFNGKPGFTRTAGNAGFCLLIITDQDGKAIDPRKYEFKKDQVLKGICNSGKPVINQETGEDTGLTWAEPYVSTQSE